MQQAYSSSAALYDKLYGRKDYAGEVAWLVDFLRPQGRPRLLDLACGSGRHLEHFRRHFEAEGLDLSPELLRLAASRVPDLPLTCADLVDFRLPRRFDLITCLFSSIGYVHPLERLQEACRNMARHLAPGGQVLIEPWFTPGSWKPDTAHALWIDEPDLKIARVNTSLSRGRLSIMEMHHLVGTPQETRHFVESHELMLYTPEELRQALEEAGFEARWIEDGPTGRGLHHGRLPGDAGA